MSRLAGRTARSHRFQWGWLYAGSWPPENANVADTLSEVYSRWNLAGVVGGKVLDWAQLATATPAYEALRERVELARAVARVQLEAARQLDQSLVSSGLDHVFFKAVALQSAYPEAFAGRVGGDVDMGIRRGQYASCLRVLTECGYGPRGTKPGSGPFRYARHFEAAARERVFPLPSDLDVDASAIKREAALNCLPLAESPDHRIGVAVSVDLHLDLSLDIPLTTFLDEGVHRINGVWCLRPAEMIATTTMKLYFESVWQFRGGLHMFFDLIHLLRAAPEPELARALKIMDRHNIAVAAFYVLRRLPSDFGFILPAILQDYIMSMSVAPAHLTPSQCNDFGDMWPKLMGRR